MGVISSREPFANIGSSAMFEWTTASASGTDEQARDARKKAKRLHKQAAKADREAATLRKRVKVERKERERSDRRRTEQVEAARVALLRVAADTTKGYASVQAAEALLNHSF